VGYAAIVLNQHNSRV